MGVVLTRQYYYVSLCIFMIHTMLGSVENMVSGIVLQAAIKTEKGEQPSFQWIFVRSLWYWTCTGVSLAIIELLIFIIGLKDESGKNS